MRGAGLLIFLFALGDTGCVSNSISETAGFRVQAARTSENARAVIRACSVAKPDFWTCKVTSFWSNPIGAVSAALEEAGVSSRIVGDREDIIGALVKNGFLRLEVKSEKEIPAGSVVVYDGPMVYVELKGDDGFYYSNQARKGSAFDSEIETTKSADFSDEQNISILKTKVHFESFLVFAKPAV